jgi:hypothetical protein
MAACVTLRNDSCAKEKTWLYHAKALLKTSLSHVIGGVSLQPRCMAPVASGDEGPISKAKLSGISYDCWRMAS